MKESSGRTRGAGTAAAAVAAAALIALPGTADANDTRGFVLGFDLGTSHADFEDPPESPAAGAVYIDDTGGGGTFLFGYGFSETFTLRLNLSGAQHETTDPATEFWINSGTVEAMILFREGQDFRPYVLGGLGGFSARSRRDDFDFEVTGPGVVVGAGFAYFTGEHFALDFGLRGDFINWEDASATVTFPNGTQATVDAPIEESGSAAKFLFGVSWWFGGGE